jgi:hypothetical protein
MEYFLFQLFSYLSGNEISLVSVYWAIVSNHTADTARTCYDDFILVVSAKFIISFNKPALCANIFD